MGVKTRIWNTEREIIIRSFVIAQQNKNILGLAECLPVRLFILIYFTFVFLPSFLIKASNLLEMRMIIVEGSLNELLPII